MENIEQIERDALGPQVATLGDYLERLQQWEEFTSREYFGLKCRNIDEITVKNTPPVTSIVQYVKNRELGVKKAHTCDVAYFLEIHEDILRLTGSVSKCTCRSSKRNKRVACYQRRYKNWTDYFEERGYFGRMDMPSPSTSCQSSEYDADSDHESEESDMREPRL